MFNLRQRGYRRAIRVATCNACTMTLPHPRFEECMMGRLCVKRLQTSRLNRIRVGAKVISRCSLVKVRVGHDAANNFSCFNSVVRVGRCVRRSRVYRVTVVRREDTPYNNLRTITSGRARPHITIINARLYGRVTHIRVTQHLAHCSGVSRHAACLWAKVQCVRSQVFLSEQAFRNEHSASP